MAHVSAQLMINKSGVDTVVPRRQQAIWRRESSKSCVLSRWASRIKTTCAGSTAARPSIKCSGTPTCTRKWASTPLHTVTIRSIGTWRKCPSKPAPNNCLSVVCSASVSPSLWHFTSRSRSLQSPQRTPLQPPSCTAPDYQTTAASTSGSGTRTTSALKCCPTRSVAVFLPSTTGKGKALCTEQTQIDYSIRARATK